MLRTRAPLIALLAAAASLLPALASADAWIAGPGEYYSEISASRAFSDTYYDSSGARFILPQSQRFELRQISFHNEIGWKKRVSVVIGAPIKSVTNNFPDFGVQRTETGFGDIHLGFKVRLMDGPSALAAKVELIAPLGYDKSSPAALGGGEQLAHGQLLFGTTFKSLNAFLEASGGYLSPLGSGDPQYDAHARLGIWMGSSLLLLGNYDGAWISGDSDLAFDDHRMNIVGPELRYRVDDRLDVFAGSRHVASGRGALHDDGYFVGMAFRQSKHNRLQGLLGNKTQP